MKRNDRSPPTLSTSASRQKSETTNDKEVHMLGDSNVKPMLPVKDLGVATKLYEEKLGLRRVGGAPRPGIHARPAQPLLAAAGARLLGAVEVEADQADDGPVGVALEAEAEVVAVAHQEAVLSHGHEPQLAPFAPLIPEGSVFQ